MKKAALNDIYKRIADAFDFEGFVWGSGNESADIMLIGEAPGKEEIKSGKPFTGAAGVNLTEFLESLGLKREQIFITNVCKFRPTKTSAKGIVSNRTPNRAEIEAAKPFLREEIKAVNPKFIVTLGNTALHAVSGNPNLKIGDFHGRILRVNIDGGNYKLFALYHPASIIYNRELKSLYYEDLIKLKRALEETSIK